MILLGRLQTLKNDMEILTNVSPILNIFTFLGSLAGVFFSLNNKLIKQESKVEELENRFNRKDSYDEKLKEKVDNINDTLTEVATIIKSQKR